MGVRKTTVIGVAALFVLLQSLAFADQITDRARLLLQQKNPQAAYRLLEPLESQRAGDPEYDYLLGIAALDSGERERAVFALERVLAVNPKHAQARAEIARAYFEMGEKVNAKREFENVRASNPPEAVKQTIDRYLSALEAGPTRFSGFVELGFGHDSNVNSATSANQIAIPALGGIVAALAPSGVKQSDNFATAGGGLNYVYGFSPEWAVLAGVAANGKFNRQHGDFDTATVDGNLGLRWSRDKEAITVGYQGQDFQVNHDDFRRTNGAVAQWQHNYSEYSQVSIFAQAADLGYPRRQREGQGCRLPEPRAQAGGRALRRAGIGHRPIGAVRPGELRAPRLRGGRSVLPRHAPRQADRPAPGRQLHVQSGVASGSAGLLHEQSIEHRPEQVQSRRCLRSGAQNFLA